MGSVDNRFKSLKDAIIDLFTIDLSFKKKKYFYIDQSEHKNAMQTDWENVGNDLRKSMDQFDFILKNEQLEGRQGSFNFENQITGDGEKEEDQRKQPV